MLLVIFLLRNRGEALKGRIKAPYGGEKSDDPWIKGKRQKSHEDSFAIDVN